MPGQKKGGGRDLPILKAEVETELKYEVNRTSSLKN